MFLSYADRYRVPQKLKVHLPHWIVHFEEIVIRMGNYCANYFPLIQPPLWRQHLYLEVRKNILRKSFAVVNTISCWFIVCYKASEQYTIYRGHEDNGPSGHIRRINTDVTPLFWGPLWEGTKPNIFQRSFLYAKWVEGSILTNKHHKHLNHRWKWSYCVQFGKQLTDKTSDFKPEI